VQPEPLPDPHIRDLYKIGMNHICFAVENIEAEVAGGSTRILKIAIQGLAAEFRPVLPKMPNLDITDRATSRQPTAMSHVFSRRFLDYRAD
jgi:hypothetical protein